MMECVIKQYDIDKEYIINSLIFDIYVCYHNARKLMLIGYLMRKKPVEKIERLQLDRILTNIRNSTGFEKPRQGWIKTIRENLGMTVKQLARRAGISPVRITEIERSEINGNLTFETFLKVARALNCRFVYTLVPEKSLQNIVEEQALKKATMDCKNVYHSMVLEDQAPDRSRMEDFIKIRAEEMLQKKISKIWED